MRASVFRGWWGEGRCRQGRPAIEVALRESQGSGGSLASKLASKLASELARKLARKLASRREAARRLVGRADGGRDGRRLGVVAGGAEHGADAAGGRMWGEHLSSTQCAVSRASPPLVLLHVQVHVQVASAPKAILYYGIDFVTADIFQKS